MPQAYPTGRRRGSEGARFPTSSLAPQALGFLAPLPALAPAAVPDILGPTMLPVLRTVFPWLAGVGLLWLLYEFLDRYAQRITVPGGRLSTGNAVLAIPCAAGPKGPDWVSNYAGTCNFTGSNPVGQINAPVGAGQYFSVGRAGALNGSLPGYRFFTYGDVYQMRSSGGTQPSQSKPLQIGVTYPLGDPGVDPYALPSLFPMLAPYVAPGMPFRMIPFPTIPEFDRLAELEWSPWVHRQVGPSVRPSESPWFVPDVGPAPETPPYPVRPPLPSPGESPSTDVPPWIAPSAPVAPPWTWPFLPPQVDPSEPSPVPFPPIDVTDPETPPIVDVLPGGDLGPPVLRDPEGLFQPPAPRRKERKLRATPHALRMILMVATYSGATVRNLHKSLPRDCRSRKKKGQKRRYDSMLKDVYRCIDRVDLDKFLILETETFARLAAIGYIGNRIDAARRPGGDKWSSGFGVSTNILHGMGPEPGQPLLTPHGGAFSGRQDPFGIFGYGVGQFNQWAFGWR